MNFPSENSILLASESQTGPAIYGDRGMSFGAKKLNLSFWQCTFKKKKKKKRKRIRLHHDMHITPLFACCMTLHTGAALSSSPFHSGTLHYVSNEGSPHQCVNSYNILALRIQKRHDHTHHDINQLVNQLLI